MDSRTVKQELAKMHSILEHDQKFLVENCEVQDNEILGNTLVLAAPSITLVRIDRRRDIREDHAASVLGLFARRRARRDE